jgi:hypothetical protein
MLSGDPLDRTADRGCRWHDYPARVGRIDRSSQRSRCALRCRRTEARKWKEEQLAESYDAAANGRLIVSLGCHRTPSAVWDGAPACATIVTGSGRLGRRGS